MRLGFRVVFRDSVSGYVHSLDISKALEMGLNIRVMLFHLWRYFIDKAGKDTEPTDEQKMRISGAMDQISAEIEKGVKEHGSRW